MMTLRQWCPRLAAFLWLVCVAVLVGGVSSSLASKAAGPLTTNICGTIDTDRTWAPGSVYVADSCTVTVNPNVTLTVQPGAVVKFRGSTLVINGRLLAQGNDEAPVVFTSYWDDAHGGDTDGESRSAGAGDWASVVINGPGSVLDHGWIGYGSAWWDAYCLADLCLNTSDVTIQDSVFASSFYHGIFVGAFDPTHPLRLTGNTFLNNNHWAVYAKPAGSWADVVLAGNSSSGSPWNGFGLEGTINAPVSFSTTASFPFMAEQEVTVAAGSTLTLTPGATFKFGGKHLTVNGRLLARGAAADPIIFTSFRDDAHGGNANGDDNPPEPGNWSGLVINGPGSIIEHAWIGYAGAWYGGCQANLCLTNSDARIEDSIIALAFKRGIAVDGAAPTILGNQIYGQPVGIYTANGSLPIVRGNEIRDNSEAGLINADLTATVDAGSNWWGSATGPKHPTRNATGTGNPVSDGVAFGPWYSEFEWVAPYTSAVHGAETLAWKVFGRDATGITADLALRGAGDWQSLADGQPPVGSRIWDTRALADGGYDLRVRFYDAGAHLLAERTRRVFVLNRPGIAWHAGATGMAENWPASQLHLLADRVILPNGAQVTIQPGAVVKAAADAGLQIANGATLHATGSAGSPIIFTSLADDTADGDTNADGDGTLPAPGDWRGIAAYGSGLADVNAYTDVRYAQALHAGTLAGNATWSKSLLHVVIAEVIVPDGVTLTIEPDAVVKFDRRLGITAQAGGRIVARGTVAAPIVFTSLADDTIVGDTNRDGAASGPAAGDWRGILLDGGQAAFDHATLSYAGGSTTGSWDSAAGAVAVRNAGVVTLANSLILKPYFEGILAWGSGDVTATSSVIAGADRGVNADGSAIVRLTNCTLDDNRIGVWGHGGTLQVQNTIIAHSLEAGLENPLGSPLTWRYNDVWSATGVNYRKVADQTGSNGNISANPKLAAPDAGDYRLSFGSPVIDAADGGVAPATDLRGATRYDDPYTPNTGTPAADGSYVDMGAYEFVLSTAAKVDLAVTGVTGAATGQQATVTWTVANRSGETAVGPWSDAVYLSASATFDGSARLLGQVLHEGILAAGASYEASLTQALPLLPDGSYHIVVVTDGGGQLTDTDRSNNTAAAPGRVTISIPNLPMDTDVSGTIAAGQDRFYRLLPPAGRDILITGNFAAAYQVEFYARYGALPQRDVYDARADNPAALKQPLFLSSAQSAPVGVWLRGSAAAAGGTSYTLRAATLGFSVIGISPNRGSSAGQVTLAVAGANFTAGTTVSLVRIAGASRAATSVTFVDGNHLNATFNLSGLAAGLYDIVGADGGQTSTLAGAFTVSAGPPGSVQARVQSEQYIRPGRGGLLSVEYWNDGETDVTAPLLILRSDNASFRLQEDQPWVRDTIQLLGISGAGPAGVLPPGGRGTVQVFFMPNNAGSGVTSRFDLALPASDASPLGWIGAKEAMRPAYIPADAWDPIYANYQARLGDTVGSYQAALAEAATYLSEVGVYTGDVGRLGAFLLRLSDNWGGISQRYAVGAFGRGLPDPTDYAALPQADGSVIVCQPGSQRFFLQTSDGYAGSPGENGVLARLASGAFTLRETEGTLTVFRTDGKLDHVEDPNGNRMTPQYNGGRMSGLAWTNGDTATFEYNGAGRISRIIDVVGRQIVFTYDGAGEHLLSITDAGGSLSFSYLTGQGAAREHALASLTNPDGAHLYAQYDAQGRLSRLSNDGDAQWTSFSYNLGQVTATAKSGSTTVTRQDELGQLRQTVDGLSRSFRQERDADGNLTALISPGGLRSTLGYDALGNLDWFRLPGGGRTDLNFSPIPSRLLAAQDPAGHTQGMAYDSVGNLTVHNHPDGSRETYAYDTRGNLTEFVNRAGRAIRLTYNTQDLVARKTYADGSRIDYGYDAHRNVTSATFTPAGAAAASWTAPTVAQVTSFQYDAADRLTRITYPNGRYVAYAYDSGGRLSGISTPEGALVSYGYDAAGRLVTVGNPVNPAQPFAAYAYNAAGQVSRVDYPNSTSTEYQYDAAGRVTSVVNRSGSSVHASFAYTYDTAGRIQTMTTRQGTATYAYDADGRLTSTTLPGHSAQYTYDAAGNRVSATEDGVSTAYTTNSLDQYTAAGPLTFGYDATGNLAAIGGGVPSTYAYDDEGRLTRTVTPAGTWAYEYDVLGNLSAVIKDGVRTEYLVDPQGLGEVVGEYGAGGLVARYVRGLNLVGRVDAGGAAAYYELDALGSVAGLSGAGGALLNQYSYLPFGQTAAASETVSNPFKFTGSLGVMDDGSGLLYMRRRYYAPLLGRFTGPDPLRSPGINAYVYALNSPLAYADPQGLAVTADRFGGFADSFSYGEGVGRIAPGASQAYEALVVAQAPQPRPGLVLHSQGSYTREFPWDTRFEPCNPNSVRGPDCFWRETRGGGGEWVMPAVPKPEPSVNPFAPRRIDKFTTVYFGEGTITFVYQIPGQPPEWSRYVYYNGQQGKLIASSDPPTTKQSSSSVQQVASHDPNDMVGPAGFGSKNYVAGDQALMYTIRFENDKAATAPAQVVRLTQTLDPALDRGAFELVAVGFGGRTWAIPDGRASYSTRFDVRSTLGLFVDFQAEFNTLSGELVATLTSIDPATGALPTNLMSGFLPPNVIPPQGDGFLTYRVRPRAAAPSGTQVQAAGRVVFDDNPPIDTPVISNALDMGYPTGTVSPLPATVFQRFTVAWSGSDETGGSGVGAWDLYVSKNGGPFALSMAGTPATSTTVQGEVGATYAFYVLAIDNTGRRQKTPGTEQSTMVMKGGRVLLPLVLRAK